MLESPHVLLGAAIATKVGNPWVALPLAFLSHFTLEVVPHWNPHLNTEVKKYGKVTKRSTAIIVGDVLFSLSLGGFIAFSKSANLQQALTILLACFFAVLPDVIEGPYFFLKVKGKFIEKWISFQKSLQNDAQPLLGIFTQVLTIVLLLLWIY